MVVSVRPNIKSDFPVLQYSKSALSADISGVPGTGKTATVHRIVRELKRMAERNVSTLQFTRVLV